MPIPASEDPMGRTTKQPIIGNPLSRPVEKHASLPKAGELIEIVPDAPFTQSDRTVLNLLIVNAWPHITQEKEHCIPKRMLRGTHESTDRLSATISHLMKTLVEIRVIRDGKPSRLKFQLLGPTIENRNNDGNLYYRFLPELIEVIALSDHWARLNVETMLSMESKYSLVLYEMVEKRAGLTSKHRERFTIEEFRAFLGVPDGKLERWYDLKRKCIEPAVREVAAKSSCHVRVDAVKPARPVRHVELSWFPKDEQGLKASYGAKQAHKAGRKVRIAKQIDTITAPDPALDSSLDDL
jgi:hypothetical protein